MPGALKDRPRMAGAVDRRVSSPEEGRVQASAVPRRQPRARRLRANARERVTQVTAAPAAITTAAIVNA